MILKVHGINQEIILNPPFDKLHIPEKSLIPFAFLNLFIALFLIASNKIITNYCR